jgi:carotenoid 1,2-hydratase
LSGDVRHGITLIAFVGSVFSPYYAFARRRGSANPLNHCALNVAIYGDQKRWAMTERRSGVIMRGEDHFTIGPSQIGWDGESLRIEIDEITNPFPSRLRGTIRVYPSALTETSFDLDASGRHRWWPIAPCARIEVDLAQPGLRWIGDGYFDLNHGDAPLQQDFAGWEWSRAGTRKGTVISYDTSARDGQDSSQDNSEDNSEDNSKDYNLALRVDRSGTIERLEPLARTALPRTGWRIARSARADAALPVKVVRTLEDAPFYARSQLAATLFGEATDVMHESLSLDRFRSPIVQAMLPFRMPRW